MKLTLAIGYVSLVAWMSVLYTLLSTYGLTAGLLAITASVLIIIMLAVGEALKKWPRTKCPPR